jgi:hypothetical protein
MTHNYKLKIGTEVEAGVDLWVAVLYPAYRRPIEFRDATVRGLLVQVAEEVIEKESSPISKARLTGKPLKLVTAPQKRSQVDA